MAVVYGSHPRYSHSLSGRTAPASHPSALRYSSNRPGLPHASIVSPSTTGRYNDTGVRRNGLEESSAHRTEPILRKIKLVRTTSHLPQKTPGTFYQQGYTAGVTLFGHSPDGRSAAQLLTQEHAVSTSEGYGYKWKRFTTFCGTNRCPLPSSVVIIGCYLSHLYREGRITGTLIRPYLAAICAMHTRAGFPSPTEDPVINSIRAGFKRATADRVVSRPGSVALPSTLSALALKKALRAPRPVPATAIAVGFLLALRSSQFAVST
jgi:hypothetical protein